MWMVRAGIGGDKVQDFHSKGLVAFGDERLGKVPDQITKQALLKLYAEKYPDEKEGSRASWASQLFRLLTEVQVGDAVVTYDPERRVYLIGKVTSGYEWMPGIVEGLPHARKVEWTHQTARSTLSVTARNTLGAIQTLFQLSPEVAEEVNAKKTEIGATPPTESKPKVAAVAPDEASGLAALRNETVQKADSFIEDAISGLDAYEMQDLVAGILRAMGYRTTVSPPGSDRGVDVMASPDGLMLQEPRIFVEVKHRTGTAMGSKEIRSFLGGRKPGDRCLYVSTGGFRRDAHYEADRSNVPLTLVNLEALRKLLIDNYDRLDPDTRALVPLRKFYWPVVEE